MGPDLDRENFVLNSIVVLRETHSVTMPSVEKDSEFDALFDALGWRGRHQIVQIIWLMMLNLPLAFNLMSIVFIGYYAPSRCRQAENTSQFIDNGLSQDIPDVNVTYHECRIILTSNFTVKTELPCENGYEYLQPRKLSLVSEWDLVCGKETLVDLLQTLYMFGMGIGAVVFCVIGDKLGRKFAHVSGGMLLFIVASSMAFIPSYTPFAVMRIVLGACHMGTGLTGVALSLEIVPTRHRSKIGILGGVVWGISVVVYAVAAYLMKSISWRYHQLVIGLTGSYFLLLPWILDESCRWLGSMHKYHAAERILRKAARTNGQDEEMIAATFREKIAQHEHIEPMMKEPQSDHHDSGDPSASLTKADSNVESSGKWPILQIFQDKQMFAVSAITWFMWFTNTVTYYGLSLTSTEFHSDKYIGFGLSATMELASSFMFWLTVDRFGRKKSSLAFHFIAGVSLVLSVVFGHFTDTIPSLSAAVTTFSLIGKFAITVSFNILWLYTPELFPTTIRNVGFGLASLSGRVGGILAPYSKSLHRLYPWAPGTIFSSCCILVILMIRFLPETADCELAQTIQEMKTIITNKGGKKDRGGQKVKTKEDNVL